MPLLTYSINSKLLENINELNINNLNKFNLDLEDLNYSEKAVYLNEKKFNLLKKIEKKIIEMTNENLDINMHQRVYSLTNLIRVINSSIIYENESNNLKILPDFLKDKENEIERSFKNKIIKGQYNANDFDCSSDKLKRKFLDKIKIYIIDKNRNKKNINNIYIFHKELSKMILPVYKNEKRSIIKLNRYQKQIKKIYDKVNLNHDMQEYIENENLLRIQNIRDRFYVKNLKIVKNSINLFLNWWLTFDEKLIPQNIKIISDIPESLFDESIETIRKAENTINKFLFSEIINLKLNNIKIGFRFLDRKEFANIPELSKTEEIWTHKRHFIFGKDQNLVFSSQFGVELLSNSNPDELRKKTVLQIEEDEKDTHLQHFKFLIPYLERKI